MSSTPLVAKGSFLFSPTATKRKKSASSGASTYDGDGFLAFPGEPAKSAQQRYESFQRCSNVVDTIFKNLSQLQHRDLVVSLIECLSREEDPTSIARSHCVRDVGGAGSASEEEDYLRLYQWPSGSQETLHLRTIALSAGANALDHGLLFDYLQTRLHKDITPFVVLLTPNDCSTMKRLLRLLCAAVQQADESCPDHSTISALFDWLHLRHYADSAKGSRPGKDNGGDDGTFSTRQPVVIILQDFEGFQTSLLDDFISLCHAYLDRLPFRLIFGLSSSSSSENVSTLLPPGINQLLAITSFRSASASSYLSTIVDKVLFSPRHNFRLGYHSLAVLVTHFLNVNHSVASLHQGIKLVMLEHFRSMPLSQMCVTAASAENAKQFCAGSKECDLLRSLPTTRSYVEAQEPQEQLDLLQDNSVFKRFVGNAVLDLQVHHRQLLPSLNAVHTLFRSLPEPSVGKQVLDIYCGVLKGPLVDGDAFKNAVKCFKLLSRNEIVGRLKGCVTALAVVSANAALCQRCSQAAASLEQLSTRSASTSDSMQSTRGDECADTDAAAADSALLSTAGRRHRLHQRLRSFRGSDGQQKEFNSCLSAILDELVEHFRHALRPPSLLPLSELFYCGTPSANLLQQITLASPRLAVQQALLNPQPILQCACCDDSPDAPTVTMPALSVAYWICTECPRNINLHDWLVSFFSVVKADSDHGQDSGGAKKKKRKEADVEDCVWQSAFIQSVSELQLLGFIKSTRQKTDHVRRLVWGRC